MPPHRKPARRVSARVASRKSSVSSREFERLLERAAKYLSERGKQLVRAAHPRSKAHFTAA